jgi:hypothetical protein
LSVEFFAWDSIDREEVGIGSDNYTISMDIKVESFLSCTDVQLDNGPDEWNVEMDIANGSYSVDGIEVEPDFNDSE